MEAQVEFAVLERLGIPPEPFRVAVTNVFDSNYRVNVWRRDYDGWDIAHTYFLKYVKGEGIVSSNPDIHKVY